jgi:N-acetylmuramoyl-L-alanine amidase
MKNLNALKALWMVLAVMAVCASSYAAERFAAIHYTYYGKQLKGYRIADECFVPLQTLSEIGWTATVGDKGAKVLAEGKTFLVPPKTIDQKECVPFRRAIEILGGTSVWIPGGYDALEVFSSITKISSKNGKLIVDSALTVKPTVMLLGQNRVIVDLDGAKLTKNVAIDIDKATSVIQFQADKVRITYNLSNGQILPGTEIAPSKKLQFDFFAANNPEPKLEQKEPKPEIKPVSKPEQKQEPKNPPKREDRNLTNPQQQTPIEIPLPLSVMGEGKNNLELALKFPKGFFKSRATAKVIDRETIEILVPGTRCFLPKLFKLKSGFVKDIETTYDDNSTVLRIITSTPMQPRVESAEDLVYISLVDGESSNQITGDLSGKVIYLDAGHGGEDHGSDYAGVYEKNITLSISRIVYQALVNEGATVIMSRNDDTFPSLTARPNEANTRKADIFISIHANKVEPGPYIKAGKPLPSGTITFFHSSRESDRKLATAIHNELVAKKLLPDLGVKSDFSIYPNKGFAVLRLAKMPAILLETGFVMHPKDREVIQSREFAEATAKSIIDGLKIYFSNR